MRPRGLLTALAYWDLVPIRDQPALVRDVVLTAIKPGRHKGDGLATAEYWRAARTAAFPEMDNWSVCERLISHVRAVTSQVTADSREVYWLLTAAGTYLQGRAALADVMPLYRRGLAIADRLAKADPENAGWQRDLSVSRDNIGDVLRAQGNLAAALDSYQASQAIFDRLAKADSGNAGWQRDLSVSHNKIGDVLVEG